MKKEVEEIQVLLRYETDRHLVGVKFIKDEIEYENCDVKEATHQMFFCMMVKAATIGHSLKVRKQHIYCSAASKVLGFEEITDEDFSGECQYKRMFYENRKIAKDVADNTPYIHHKVYGMIVQPLEKYNVEPDIVISFSNPYTAMRIMQGYAWKYGVPCHLNFKGMGGICTELMANAYKCHDISVSLLCSGTRFAGNWRDEEVGVAFPYDVFKGVLEGIRNTMNLFESDTKKQEIMKRAREQTWNVDVIMGDNYYGSSLGVAKMGVKGYRKKKEKKCQNS